MYRPRRTCAFTVTYTQILRPRVDGRPQKATRDGSPAISCASIDVHAVTRSFQKLRLRFRSRVPHHTLRTPGVFACFSEALCRRSGLARLGVVPVLWNPTFGPFQSEAAVPRLQVSVRRDIERRSFRGVQRSTGPMSAAVPTETPLTDESWLPPLW